MPLPQEFNLALARCCWLETTFNRWPDRKELVVRSGGSKQLISLVLRKKSELRLGNEEIYNRNFGGVRLNSLLIPEGSQFRRISTAGSGGEHVRLRNSKKNVESNNTISYYFRDYVVAPDPMHDSRFTSEYSLAVNLVRFKLPRKHLSTAE